MFRTRWGRATAVTAGLAMMAATLSGCITAKAGSRCSGNGVAQDATFVLQCKRGRWVRVISKADGQRLLDAFNARLHPTTTAAPTTTTEAPTTTTTAAPTTTTTPPPTFPSPELLSLQPPGEIPAGWGGTGPRVSADGRYVAFDRTGTCGPVIRDRVASATTAPYGVAVSTDCQVRDTLAGFSADGRKLLLKTDDAQCPSPPGFSFAPGTASYSIVTSKIDPATPARVTPIPCTNKLYFGGVAPGWTTTVPASPVSIGTVGTPTLTPDGTAILLVHQTNTYTLGALTPGTICDPAQMVQPTCYGPLTQQITITLEKVAAADNAAPTVLATLYTGAANSVSGPQPLFPGVEISSVSNDGSVIALNSTGALTGADTNSVPDGYLYSGGSLSLIRPSVDGSTVGSVSGSGRYVLFSTAAADVVSGDTNGTIDLFLLDRTTSAVERESVATGGAQSNRGVDVTGSAVSDDGRFVTFASDASTLGCAGHYATMFVHDRSTSTTRAPFHRADGLPAMSSAVSSFSFAMGVPGGAIAVSADGSTLVGSSSDWLGTPAADPGISLSRIWATPTLAPGVPVC